MNNDISLIHAGSALHSWLNYISSVKRIYILAENSIKYPISEYLGTKLDPTNIHLDKLHPDLNDRYLDLRYFEEINFQNTEIAIEFKYARLGYTDHDAEKKRIFDDIMRLKIFIEQNDQRKGYFLMCGTQIDFIKAFQSIGWNDSDKINGGIPQPKIAIANSDKNIPKGFFTNWFKFEKNDTAVINLATDDLELKRVYDNFFEKYEKSFKTNITKGTLLAKNPVTRLVYLSESLNLTDIPPPMKVGIWEVTSS